MSGSLNGQLTTKPVGSIYFTQDMNVISGKGRCRSTITSEDPCQEQHSSCGGSIPDTDENSIPKWTVSGCSFHPLPFNQLFKYYEHVARVSEFNIVLHYLSLSLGQAHPADGWHYLSFLDTIS